MGMILALQAVSNQNIQKILESPILIWKLIAVDDPDIYQDVLEQRSKKGFFSRWFGKKASEDQIPAEDLELSEAEKQSEDLDKAWQGIHYCLNGTEFHAEPPMDFLTVGGKTAGDEDVGYGPARLIESGMVQAIHERLKTITTAELRKHYDPVEMEKLDIYPNIWVRDGDEGFDYIAEYFVKLKSFVETLAKADLGMAVYLC